MTEITLRPATSADGEFAFQVWKAAMQAYIEATWGWDDDWQCRRQQEEFTALPYQIIEADGQPIGTLIVKHAPDHIYLSGLYFLPEHQRLGYGSAVLEGLLAEGRTRNVSIRLRVLKVNPQARRLYERLVFAVIDEEEHFVVMEKLPEEAISEARIPVSIRGVYLSEDDGAFAARFALLQDNEGRQARIYIGECEAKLLLLGLGWVRPDRPDTYEAMLACLRSTGAILEEVRISHVRDGTFYAVTSLRAGGQIHEVDMRPSDALNLAVRTRCPIFVSDMISLELSAVNKPPIAAAVPAEQTVLIDEEISEAIARVYAEDQRDRTVQSIDWDAVGPRDAARLAFVKQFYQDGALQTGMDFYHAAMVLQHSPGAEDHLLAHELCVVAMSQGVEQAKWLAAASEDRFLMNIGQPQRFGTQYQKSKPSGSWSLYRVSSDVTDELRDAFNVPSLFQAQARTDEMSKKPE